MNIVEKLRLMQTDHIPELGEAVAEIERLRFTLQWIIDADWRSWDEEVRSPDDFVAWAKSRARYALTPNYRIKPCNPTTKID